MIGVVLPPLSILGAFWIDAGLGWILLAYAMLQVFCQPRIEAMSRIGCHGIGRWIYLACGWCCSD